MTVFTDKTFAENAYINNAKQLSDKLGIKFTIEKNIIHIIVVEDDSTYKFDSAYYALLFMQAFSRGYAVGYIKGSKK